MYTNSLEFFNTADYPFFPQLCIIQSFIYVSIDSWVFILHFGLLINMTLFILVLMFFQLWPVGALEVGSCVLLTEPLSFCFVFF